MEVPPVFAGVDVSKAQLDVALTGSDRSTLRQILRINPSRSNLVNIGQTRPGTLCIGLFHGQQRSTADAVIEE